MVTKKRVMAFGTFDVLHAGHVYYLTQAAKYGNELTVVIARDCTVKRLKERKPIHDERTRLKLVQSLKPVTRALLGCDFFSDPFKIVKKVKPNVIVLGYDQRANPKRIQLELKKYGLNVKVKRVRSFKPCTHKSSRIRNQLEQCV